MSCGITLSAISTKTSKFVGQFQPKLKEMSVLNSYKFSETSEKKKKGKKAEEGVSN